MRCGWLQSYRDVYCQRALKRAECVRAKSVRLTLVKNDFLRSPLYIGLDWMICDHDCVGMLQEEDESPARCVNEVVHLVGGRLIQYSTTQGN